LDSLTYKTSGCDDQSVSDAKENISKKFFTHNEKEPYDSEVKRVQPVWSYIVTARSAGLPDIKRRFWVKTDTICRKK